LAFVLALPLLVLPFPLAKTLARLLQGVLLRAAFVLLDLPPGLRQLPSVDLAQTAEQVA
jgi:hypothetical protein